MSFWSNVSDTVYQLKPSFLRLSKQQIECPLLSDVAHIYRGNVSVPQISSHPQYALTEEWKDEVKHPTVVFSNQA